MANDLPYGSYGSSGPQPYQSDTFTPSPTVSSSFPPPISQPTTPNPQTQQSTSSNIPPADSQHPTPTTAISGSLAKEQLESSPITSNETVPILEVTSEHDKIPEAVEGWLEKLERQEDIKLDQPVTDDQNQPVLQSSIPQISTDQIVLPIEEVDIQQGIKQKPSSSVRWLAEWCLRVIKKFPGKVFYAS